MNRLSWCRPSEPQSPENHKIYVILWHLLRAKSWKRIKRIGNGLWSKTLLDRPLSHDVHRFRLDVFVFNRLTTNSNILMIYYDVNTFRFLHIRLATVISWMEYLSDVSWAIFVNTIMASSVISTSSSSHLKDDHYDKLSIDWLIVFDWLIVIDSNWLIVIYR